MKRIIRYGALALMLSLAALALGGCIDYSAMTQEMEAQLEQPEATPLPPLAEPLIENREGFYRYYNQVSLMDTLDGLSARFPNAKVEAAESEKTYTFVFDDGFGFAVVFDAKGAMRAKVPFYNDMRQLRPMASGKNLDQTGLLNKGQDYASIASMFGGKGLEIMQLPPESEDAQGVQRVYVWMDDNGSTVQASFDETGAFLSANAGNFNN